jgi:hypothetical protein
MRIEANILFLRGHAVKSFLSHFGTFIALVLSGFDRLRLRGDSRLLNNARGVDSYLYTQRVRYTDFPEHCQTLTKILRARTEEDARQQGVPLEPLNSPEIDKEAAARRLAASHPCAGGRLAVLSCVELCWTYRLRKDRRGWIKPVKERAKCVHYYHYFDHADVGLCYVRVQSWFPFTVRVGLNGRHWLCQQLQRRGVPFERRDNLLVAVGDVDLAQKLLTEQAHTDWPALLSALVQPVQPLWNDLHGPMRTPYYWTTEQSEWATDLVFRDPAELARWYPRWLRHGIETLSCRDVLRYLGKKVPDNGYGGCTGEAKIDLRARPEGTRLKFWYNSNSVKMYDKQQVALRIETTINQPHAFKVYRTKEGENPEAPKSWQRLRKGVADMDRRAEVAQAANNRLAESLATVTEEQSLGALLQPLGQPVRGDGRLRARPLNPLTGRDGALLRLLGRGEFLVNGFRNADLRRALYGQPADDDQRRRQSAAVTRQFALLRGHGIIRRLPKTHRYHLTAQGRRIVTALTAAEASDVNRLTQAA